VRRALREVEEEGEKQTEEGGGRKEEKDGGRGEVFRDKRGREQDVSLGGFLGSLGRRLGGFVAVFLGSPGASWGPLGRGGLPMTSLSILGTSVVVKKTLLWEASWGLLGGLAVRSCRVGGCFYLIAFGTSATVPGWGL